MNTTENRERKLEVAKDLANMLVQNPAIFTKTIHVTNSGNERILVFVSHNNNVYDITKQVALVCNYRMHENTSIVLNTMGTHTQTIIVGELKRQLPIPVLSGVAL